MASLTLDQLPDELIITIFSYLDLESIRSIQIVCKSFAQLLEDEVFWFSKCQRVILSCFPDKKLEGSWKLEENRNSAFGRWRELYAVLSTYRYLFGYWQWFTEEMNGVLVNFDFSTESNCITMATTVKNEDGAIHDAIYPFINEDMTIHVPVKDEVLTVTEIKHTYLEQPVKACSEALPADEHSQYTSNVLYSNEVISIKVKDTAEVYKAVKIQPPQSLDAAVSRLKPGVYSAKYGDHGEELIHVSLFDNEIIGSKLTGDVNVPYGKHSFVAELDKKLVLTDAHQETINGCFEVEESEENQTQPFRMPVECFWDEDFHNVDVESFSHCLERYSGEGTLAYAPYMHPAWSPNQLILLREDMFALLWKDLGCMSFFKKVFDIL